MSDMAFIDWQRKAAGQNRPVSRLPAFAAATLLPATWLVAKRPIVLVGLLAAGLACVLMAVIQGTSPATPRVSPAFAPAAPSAPAWLDIIKPIEIFSLEAADLAKSPRIYKARRILAGGGRQDTLAFGTLAGEEPALRLTLYRQGSETYAPAPAFADIVQLAAGAGLSVVRSGLPDLMTTRFGKFQVTNVTLSGGAASSAACSGFRLVLETPALTMIGLACGGKAAGMPRERLGCVLERLDLTSGADDRPLVEFFAATELQRNGTCAGMRLGPDMLHAAWVDDRTATPRKNLRHR